MRWSQKNLVYCGNLKEEINKNKVDKNDIKNLFMKRVFKKVL